LRVVPVSLGSGVGNFGQMQAYKDVVRVKGSAFRVLGARCPKRPHISESTAFVLLLVQNTTICLKLSTTSCKLHFMMTLQVLGLLLLG
jgi:hypothetical protein